MRDSTTYGQREVDMPNSKVGTVGPYDMLRRQQTLEWANKEVVKDH